MSELDHIGAEWLLKEVEELTDKIIHVSPSVFNEDNRYLPESVTSIPGYIRYDVNPYMREIIDCADVNSPVREVNVMKGVQITYTTMLESVMLYFMGHIKTIPMMYVTADKDLAVARVENSIIPMINQSGFADIIRSSDEGNRSKTGKTKDHLQWEGGGYMVPFGANNANKMRMFSIMVMLKDEIDAWPVIVGKDGDPDKLTDARTDGYTERAKIFRGSTPLIEGSSVIHKNYLRGDQRKYIVVCRHCNFPQFLRWETIDKKTGVIGGFLWDTENGVLNTDSVRYACQNCGHENYEHDKEYLYSADNGAHWKPTSTPVEKNIRSYHLPALYSPIGMRPWWKNVLDYVNCYDRENKKVLDIGEYQVFYNNILAEPFKVLGSKVSFMQVSAHRRAVYRLGQIPNKYAAQHSGSIILFLTCQVDVHKHNLAVSVMGWTRDMRCYVIDYWRFEPRENETDDCTELTCSVWGRLQNLIEETVYVADDEKKYRIISTLVDASFENAIVCSFCGNYESGIVPILGRDRPGKNQSIKEFSEFTTQIGTVGYKIVVDHYKDRLASVLRREWVEEAGEQPTYHFNAPVDISDKQLKELTAESRREKKDLTTGAVSYFWYRPGNKPNELWDLFVYGNAGVEILAWQICIQHFELETVDWTKFWNYIEDGALYYST